MIIITQQVFNEAFGEVTQTLQFDSIEDLIAYYEYQKAQELSKDT